MNSGNGGKPGIQTWTTKYQQTLRVLYILLRSPNHSTDLGFIKKISFYYEELEELGILSSNGGIVTLNIEALSKHSIIVDEEFYSNMLDINWLREQRKKLGLIEGQVKDEAFRDRQQARRRARRAYTKQQALKYRDQPKEELPLSDIVLEE